jgi:HD-GYP domain-containing protein (c-di-GMP phosphodiesterase class II)
MRNLGAGTSAAQRAGTVLSFMISGREAVEAMHGTHCVVAGKLAERLGLGEAVREALLEVFERWDGKGDPGRLSGDAISLPVRLIQLADVVEVFHRAGGTEAAVAVARDRSGTQFDPEVVDRFCGQAADLLHPLGGTTSWDAVIDAQPGLRRALTDQQMDSALESIADFADLKSPYMLGHSREVADLAAEAGRHCGLPDRDIHVIRRAGLVHDFGRLGVSNAIWCKRAALTTSERERIRLYPYLTERILSSSPGLAPLAILAAQHQERLDGSGYPRGLRGNMLSLGARLLATADVYRAMLEPRPYRAPLPTADAAGELRAEARACRLDGEVVDAVLRAAGHPVTRRPERPSGLTTREIEILGLVARGLTNKEIAQRLQITAKTVRNHVEHVYSKIGVSNRAAASLFATEHGLLAPAESSPALPTIESRTQ